MIRRIVNKIRMYVNPIKYARKSGATIGERCRIIRPVRLGSEPWLISIGNHVELSSNVSFITHDGSTWVFRDEPECNKILKYGKIVIHDNVFVGMDTILLPGVEIGANSIVGAGSVVTKSIPENCVYAGNPAKFSCTIEQFKQKCLSSIVEYDQEEYLANKKKVVLEMLKDKMKM